MSMLSTPTPARTMTLSRAWFCRTSAVNCVPDRTAIPSASFRAFLSAGGSLASLVSTMTSIPFSARSRASPSSARLSVTSTRCVTISDLHYTRPCQNREAGRRNLRRALTSRARQKARMSLFSSGARRWVLAHRCHGPLTHQHLLGRGHGAAGLDVMAQFGQGHLQSGQRGNDVNFVGIAHVADPNDLPLELILPADRGDSKPLGQLVPDIGILQPLGNAEGSQPLGGPRAEELHAQGLHARLAGLAHPAVPLPDALDSLLLDAPQGGPQGQDQGVRRGVRGVEFLGLFSLHLEAEIKAARLECIDLGPGFGADRQESQPRREHERLLRADAEQVNAPFVGPAFHGADARDAIDRKDGRSCGDDPADRLDRMAGSR